MAQPGQVGPELCVAQRHAQCVAYKLSMVPLRVLQDKGRLEKVETRRAMGAAFPSWAGLAFRMHV